MCSRQPAVCLSVCLSVPSSRCTPLLWCHGLLGLTSWTAVWLVVMYCVTWLDVIKCRLRTPAQVGSWAWDWNKYSRCYSYGEYFHFDTDFQLYWTIILSTLRSYSQPLRSVTCGFAAVGPAARRYRSITLNGIRQWCQPKVWCHFTFCIN